MTEGDIPIKRDWNIWRFVNAIWGGSDFKEAWQEGYGD